MARPTQQIGRLPLRSGRNLDRSGVHKGRHVPPWQPARDQESWHDSQPQFRYFYRGSWAALGRVTGWQESLLLSQGNAVAHAVILTSQFPTTANAQRAYQVILPHTTGLAPLRIGDDAAQWQTSGGVASGPQGLAGYFGDFSTYLWSGTVVVEMYADIGGKPGSVLRPPLHNPGRAIARHLASVVATSRRDD